MNKKKILIIDDQRDTQVLLKKCLQAVGYEVVQAWDGKEGLWKALEHKPDIILVDVIMPEMNGIEFVHRFREIDKEGHIPMIVISKRALIEHLFDQGIIEGFFPKPIDVKGLILKIDEVLRKDDVLKVLEKMEQGKADDVDMISLGSRKNRITRQVCHRCAHVLLEGEENSQSCPVCGYPGFYAEDICE